MPRDRIRDTNLPAGNTITRRALLQSALAAGGAAAAAPLLAFSRQAQDQDNRTTGSPSCARVMARLLNGTRFADLPPLAVDYARMLIASTLACAAPGSLESSSRIVRGLAKEHGGKPEATLWFDGTKLPTHEVARVNTILGSATTSDDTDMRNSNHQGAILVGTGLAVAECVDATGQEVLSAIVTGYEAASRMAEALRGGRPGIYGSQPVAFGGVVAAARLLHLTDQQMAHAIGLTAMTMGGLAIGTYSAAREYAGGNASLCAVNAALAAGRGYTVNDDMLEAPGGFVDVFGAGHTETLTADLKEWAIVKSLAIKLWPGSHPLSSTVEAAMNAARQSGVPPQEVAKILVSGKNRKTIGGSRQPQGFFEAIHSLPYFVASAVADKDFSWVHASPAKINSPVVKQLMLLVELDPSPSPVHYDWDWGATVTIVTKSGARYTSTVDAPRGSAPRGIEWSDVDAKYRVLMPDAHLPAERIDESLDMIHHFDKVKHVSELTRTIHQ